MFVFEYFSEFDSYGFDDSDISKKHLLQVPFLKNGVQHSRISKNQNFKVKIGKIYLKKDLLK